MSPPHVAVPIAFNLLINAVGSFLVAASMAWLAAKVLRVRSGQPRQLFLGLPLAKVLWDLAQGIPGNSFFWMKVAGSHQDRGVFTIGAGLIHGVFPTVTLSLGAQKDGHVYSQSVAELFGTLLARRVTPVAPAALAVALLCVGAVLLTRRTLRALRALADAEKSRRVGIVVGQRCLRRRRIDVLVADMIASVPFLGGVLRPFVCFPRAAYEALDDRERDAVVLHELAHLARRDLVVFACLAVFEDVFWFVPGLRARCRELRAETEVCADAWAVRAGASADALATALVDVAEMARRRPGPTLGFAQSRSSLARRVTTLLRSSKGKERLGWPAALRAALGLAIAGGILLSTSFGNH